MTTISDDVPPLAVPASEPVQRVALLERTSVILAILAAFGLAILAFAYLTVHRRTAGELDTDIYAVRTHFRILYWLDHGYFASCGLMALKLPDGSSALYSSSTGAMLITGYALERICIAMTGHPNWRLLALHNEVISLLAALLLALLGFRLARRLGIRPLHALAMAMALEAVYFTFPDNLMLYWEITGRVWALCGACIFLLLEERHGEMPSRRSLIAMGIAAFFMTYMEYVDGTALLLAFALLNVVFGNERWTAKRLILVCLLPLVLAIGLHRTQIATARVTHRDTQILGSGFIYRTGLDGSVKYYRDHLDIAYGRAVARANYSPEAIRPLLFRWQWLFFASAAATLFVVIMAALRRIPLAVIVPLLSLLGSYLLYASMFSQAVAIHPYYYDVMLFTPLMLALFVLAPSILESKTFAQGVMVVIVVFLAAWVSLFQMRRYSVEYPLQPSMTDAPK